MKKLTELKAYYHYLYLFFSLCLLGVTLPTMAVESSLWQQFKQAKALNLTPTLPDFSYAGFHYSEKSLPNTSNWPIFNVTDFGATPNDGKYDDQAIQATINAAEKSGKGVVFFPKGKFMVSPNETVGDNIFIRQSNIVIKGSGNSENGTEIFMHHKKVNNGRYMLEIKPKHYKPKKLTYVINDAQRETFVIEVADTSQLTAEQRIIIYGGNVAFAKQYYAPQKINERWTRLLDKGFRLKELHTIERIEGNKVYLHEPLHISLNTEKTNIYVGSLPMIENIGIENLLLSGNWHNYPEKFIHHKNDIHDYAWNALRFDNVRNGWIQNVEFKNWNQGVFIHLSAAITVQNITFSGKKGHMSIHARRSYGVLIKDSQDIAGHHHGAGVGYSGAGTVYLRYKMLAGQSMDSHSGSPYATLFDNVINGHFNKNGGPHSSYPHHGKYFVAWNMLLSAGPKKYDFWREKRNGHTFAMPFFIGLQGQKIKMKKGTYSINEFPGQAVKPESLFEAQLGLRLKGN